MQKAPVPRTPFDQASADAGYRLGLQHGKYLRTMFGCFSFFCGTMLGFVLGLIVGYYYHL